MAAPSLAPSLATAPVTAPTPFRLSVVIANYNYAAYVGAAIDSALAVDWADLEVIVVDDGSTDGSCDVIRSYGERIVAVFQPNAGQAEAHAVGFARSRGNVLIFLDADDLLDPTVAREIACVWREGVSKVQFQMKTIDAAGRDMGTVFPQFDVPPTPGLIRRWVLSANAYPTPPGSGNAYARSFLVKVFPLDGSSRASDSYFLAAAPFFGDVLTVPRPLVSYRVHGRNDAAFSELDVDRFGRELSRAMQRFSYAQRMAALAGFDLPGSARDRSLNLLPYRLASFRLAPGQHPIARDSGAAILRDLLRAVAAPQGVSRQARVALFAWTLLVLAVPSIAARSLVLWRFAPASRPAVVQRLLTRLRIVH